MASSNLVPVAITAIVAGGVGAAIGYALAKPKTVAAGDATGFAYDASTNAYNLPHVYTGPLPGRFGALPAYTGQGYVIGGENPVMTAMKRMGVTCASWYGIPYHDQLALMARIGVKDSEAVALATSINLLCMAPRRSPA